LQDAILGCCVATPSRTLRQVRDVDGGVQALELVRHFFARVSSDGQLVVGLAFIDKVAVVEADNAVRNLGFPFALDAVFSLLGADRAARGYEPELLGRGEVQL